MNKIYQSPLRVYLALGALALWGIICGLQLPISLFPNSSKPAIYVSMTYGEMSAAEFLNTYGRNLEDELQQISIDGTEVDFLRAWYTPGVVRYKIEFKWGADPKKALREVQNIVSAFVAPLPLEIRNSVGVSNWSDSSGFIAITFSSQKRTLDDLYNFLKPQLLPPAKRVHDATDVGIWNPTKMEVRIDLDPEKTALLGVFPRDVAAALLPQMAAYRSGSVIEGINQLNIDVPALAHDLDGIRRAVITTRAGRAVHLSEIAHVDFAIASGGSQIVKTSGVPSLILVANPKPGGNVKKMAEDILAIVKRLQPTWPKDIETKVLVDPSEFIRSAVTNVVHEVGLAAMLAVLVLFLFIGNIRNVVTAAIEIPLSMVLAFIMMKMTGINLNLISLGGLALSAGMNVDGSVVVMENIFRHFDAAVAAGVSLGPKDRLRILGEAVSEVRFPIIASTIASLVVFLPLAFTSQLTNAVLGDLAMAVVFSHGFSAVVALILVPTVRLQLMSKGKIEKSSHSVLEPYLVRLESFYSQCLNRFLSRPRLKGGVYAGLLVALALLVTLVLPRLPREIVGRPDTDWIILMVNTRGNSLLRQMESMSDVTEARVLAKFGDKIRHTFTMVKNPNQTEIMARLKDKHDMQAVWKAFEAEFVNTPEMQYYIFPWNPAELQIPDPPHLKLSVLGPDMSDRVQTGREIFDLLRQNNVFARLDSDPDLGSADDASMIASPEQWSLLGGPKGNLQTADLADVSRTATVGRRIWQMPVGDEMVPIQMGYPVGRVSSLAELEALPIGVEGKIVSLKALADIRRHVAIPDYFRENGTDRIDITGRVNKGDEAMIPAALQKTSDLLAQWRKENGAKHSSIATLEDANFELTEALRQLKDAVLLSILLIFLTMVFQFGDFVNAALVLVAIPLGIVGVVFSLWVFNSTLSLNSVLGIILLNGIAVANSIILVDFLKRLVENGHAPGDAAVLAAKSRLRPILMTSVCTGLGMIPVAMGFGEGGRILQPLGIAVVGGLAFSMLTTLFVVPSLQVGYLSWKLKRPARAATLPQQNTIHGMDWIEKRPPEIQP